MTKLTETAETVLKKRKYYQEGETEWNHLTLRVAEQFGKNSGEVVRFREIMDNLDFLPNSPTMLNAGTDIKSYSACFVLPIEDNIESIYKFYSDAAKISKSGGGVGANYSNIRAKNMTVGSTGGVASGPISFAMVQDSSTEIIKQGGKRKGANMGILDCDHADFEDFIRAKETDGVLNNFNLSARLSDRFMERVLSPGGDNGSGGRYSHVASHQWNLICKKAWEGAEPGVLFGDTIERGNTVPHLGPLEATNPCGEQPLLPYESCTLGSINLGNHVTFLRNLESTKVVDYQKLKETIRTSVLFLNRVLDHSEFPIPECQEAMEKTRKIGLGIMGLHDMLIQLGLPYDSEAGRKVAGEVMGFVAEEADSVSRGIGISEGFYGAAKESTSPPARRNANLTTIAPTGTLSMIADCSSGCEPYFSVITKKTVMDGEEFVMVNKWFEKAIRDSCVPGHPIVDTVLRKVREAGTIMIPEVRKEFQDIFKSAQEISPRDHVLMQAELQRWVDSSISKTINMPKEATVEDVKEVYELAYELGCKGVTVYRDGSREEQVLTSSPAVSPLDTSVPTSTPTDPAGYSVDNEEYDWPVPIKLDLPDVLNAKRYRIRDISGQKGYLIICHDADGTPMEIFHKQPFRDNDVLWSTVCRSVSLSLRYGVPLSDITKQLEKSSGSLNDLPAQLAKILKTYASEELSEGGDTYGGNCPECSEGRMIYQSGCENCDTCGYSKCS